MGFLPKRRILGLRSKKIGPVVHTCTRVGWLKEDEPGGRFSSCTNSPHCHRGEAWSLRSLLRVVPLDARALGRMRSTCPGVGVGVLEFG